MKKYKINSKLSKEIYGEIISSKLDNIGILDEINDELMIGLKKLGDYFFKKNKFQSKLKKESLVFEDIFTGNIFNDVGEKEEELLEEFKQIRVKFLAIHLAKVYSRFFMKDEYKGLLMRNKTFLHNQFLDLEKYEDLSFLKKIKEDSKEKKN